MSKEEIVIPRNQLEDFYEKQRLSIRKLAKIYNCGATTIQLAKIYSCSFKTILNRFREYNIKTRDISEAHLKYPKKDFSGDLIEKAYIIGFRIGDLHVRRYEENGKIILVQCGSTCPEQIILIRNL